MLSNHENPIAPFLSLSLSLSLSLARARANTSKQMKQIGNACCIVPRACIRCSHMQQSRIHDGGTAGGRFFPLAPDFRNDVDVSRVPRAECGNARARARIYRNIRMIDTGRVTPRQK